MREGVWIVTVRGCYHGWVCVHVLLRDGGPAVEVDEEEYFALRRVSKRVDWGRF